MKAPVRLLEDPRQPAELRGDLQQMAASEVDYDSARGLAGLSAALASPAPVGDELGANLDPFAASPAEALEATPQAAGAGAAASGFSVAVKLTLLAAASGMVALGASLIGTERARDSAPDRASSPASAALLPSAIQPSAVRPSSHDGIRPTPTAALEQPSPPRTAAAAAEPTPVEPAASRASARPGPSPSRREITQLNRIRALLERDPAAAHRLIGVAQREFPAGVLREEREGLAAIALFELGQPERARRQAERFVARYPNSPLRARVERLLGSPANEAP